MADAGEHIEDLAALGLGVLRTLGREQWQLQTARQLDRCLVPRFLCPVVMALQFHVHVVTAIDRYELLKRASRFLRAALRQSTSQRPFLSPRHANQSGRKFGEIVGRGNGLRTNQQIFARFLFF